MNRKKKILLAFVAVVLVWAGLITIALAVGDANENANVTTSNYSSLDKNVTADPKESSNCYGGTDYSESTATMTVKNSTGSQAIISFDYEMTGASFTVNGDDTTTTKGTYSSIMANNDTVTFTATNAGTQGTSSSIRVYNFSVVQDVDRTLTFNAATGGSITVGGIAVTTSKTVTTRYSTGVAVTATPASGYTFYGWVDANHTILSNLANTTIKPTADATITPLFIQNSSTTAYWGVGSKIFDDLSEAISTANSGATKKVVLLRDGTLPAQNYSIPSGVTVLIPFDDAGTVFTSTPEVTYSSYYTPTKFRELIMPAGSSITVQSGGELVTGSKLSSKGQLGGTNGCPTGPDGRIQMRTGSSITVNNGGNLYCWGYIHGSGDIEAKSGATVYEAFQVKDWRGGTATSNVYDYCFIFNQYYIQNIEVALKVNAGASLKLYSSVNASSSAYPIGATLIGDGGMFKITSGYILKDYNEGKDQLNIGVYGDVKLSSLVITGVPALNSVSTSNYRLPLNNMNIDIQSGKVSLDQDLEILPCAEITVARGATFEVSSNKKVYLFDNDDWGNFTGSARLYPVGYSVANGTTAVRTAANLKDARIDVDGTMDIKGYLYTSNAGADITSSNGFDGSNGKITFTTAPPSSSTTIYEMANNKDKTAVTFYPPKLHNGDDTYSATAGTGTSTWKYDKDGEHWYRFLVDFQYNGTLIQRGFFCENGATVTYDASWIVNNLGASASSGTATVSGTNVNVTGVTADSVVTLTGDTAQYIPTFVLDEEQYEIYQLYTGNTLADTVTIGDKTYYVVHQGDTALAVGTAYAAPSEASMGVTAANHNQIVWNMSGLSATSGDPYRGTVPAGETNLGPVYIYGFYIGHVAYNSYTNDYYKTLIDAFADTPTDATATITLLADCGTFEPEVATQLYTIYPNNNITLDLNGHKAIGHINNQGNFTLELNGGTLDYHTGATAAAAAYQKAAAITNSGTMVINDTAGGASVTSDAISNNSTNTLYSSAIRNESGGHLTINGGTFRTTETVNAYSADILNLSGATIDSISSGTFNPAKGCAVYNLGTVTNVTGGTFTTSGSSCYYNGATGTTTLLSNATMTSTTYCINNTSGTIGTIDNCTLSTPNATVLYNYNGGTITTLSNSTLTISAPTKANVYVLYNYGGTITTIDNCTIIGNSGINNRNLCGSNTIAQGYNISKYGTIGTIRDTNVTVGMYALYNGGTVDTICGHSVFKAQPASAQVPWPTGTAALNGNSVYAYTIVNSNQWWNNSAVWKRTDTNVTNGETTMLQRRVNEYKTDDAYMPTIGTITDTVEIIAYNTSTSNSYGYYALLNQGVINDISGRVTIMSAKHPNNTKTVYGYYALRNEQGGKINSIGSGVTISADNYAVANIGARYAQTDTTYSTTYLDSGALKSGGLATDYDYTYANVSYIGSSAATVTATSQCAYLNYGKIGSITGTVSANYNVIVNAGAAGTTTGIEGTTANVRAIEHRYFENNDSSTTANEYRRYFEYTRNTTDGCYIGTINATVTATGAGYQAITNQGYIGTIAGTVTTPTGRVTSSSTYYPLIYNGNTRQATLKQDEYYYVETNDAGATKYLREYTFEIPTIDTISCTATNPQDYTLQNYGQINNLTGSISGKTITVANEAGGPFLTRKTITFYSSASRFAASKASSEVAYEYTKQPAGITNITGATIKATGGTVALRNYGLIGTISGSEITSSSTGTITNGSSTVTEYTSNRLDVLTGCVPNGTSSCALTYDTTQTIDENEVRMIGTIDTIGAGNYIQGTGTAITNTGRINTIDSGDGATTIIYTTGNASNVYNYDGQYTRRTNTAAELTNTTGTLTNHYTYDYVGAYIGTIKNVYILGKCNAVFNGAATADANYTPTIHEIGESAEIRNTAAGYDVILNNAGAKIETISGGVFTCKAGSNYALNNASTNVINITGGDFRGGDATRPKAINDPDNTAKYTYLDGSQLKILSSTTETKTYHTLSSKVLTATSTKYYFITNAFTVTFHMNNVGTAPDVQVIESGMKANAPDEFTASTSVTKDGVIYYFGGWYTEAGCTDGHEWSFDTPITEDKDLYAKWISSFTVTFNMQGHGNQIAPLENVALNSTITAPTPPTADGFTFGGWFTEAECTSEWKFATDKVMSDMTLFAKWRKNLTNADISITNGTATYNGEVQTPILTVKDGAKTLTAGTDYTVEVTTASGAKNVDTYELKVTGIGDYADEVTTATFTITPKELTITWANTELTYNGESQAPTATPSSVYGSDDVTLSVSGAQIDAGGPYTATASLGGTDSGNYSLPASNTTNFTIGNASQDAPTDLNGVAETYRGQGNGSITGVTTAMEYRKGTTGSFTKVTAAMLTDGALTGLTSGSYEVRLAAKTNYNASPATTVNVGEGDLIPITWDVEGATTTSKVEYGETPNYTGETPTKKGDAQYSYTFSGWTPTPAAVTGPTTYTAQFTQTVNTYTVTWTMAGDGPTEAEFKAAVDAMITARAGTLAQDPDTSVTVYEPYILPYMLEDWGITGSDNNYVTNMVLAVGLNDDRYLTTANTYWDSCKDTIVNTLINAKHGSTDLLSASEKAELENATSSGGATVLETDLSVPYGTVPTYDGETPTKEGDAQYSYIFAGWSTDGKTVLDSLTGITGDTTYIAVFTQTVNEYAITWLDGDGNTLKTEQVAYGETPAYTGDTPTKEATAQYTYTFNNTWSPEIVSVTGAATYTAQFDSVVNEYTITWVDGTGETLKTDTLDYGETPVYTGTTPTKAATAQYSYTFSGWKADGGETVYAPSEALPMVAGNVTYTAQFEAAGKPYTVTFTYTLKTKLSDASAVEEITGTYTYIYGEPIHEPEIQYYKIDHWTINGGDTEYKTVDALADALAEMITPANGLPEGTSVEAIFVRKTYTVQIWTVVGDGEPEYTGSYMDWYTGRSLTVGAPSTWGGEKFSYWKFGKAEDDFSKIDPIPEIKTSYFNGTADGDVIRAVAYYGQDTTGLTSTENPKLEIVYFGTENTGTGDRVVMTLHVTAPPDRTGYEVQEVGFGYTTSLEDAKNGKFVEMTPEFDWNHGPSGTFTWRFTFPDGKDTLYTYAYMVYRQGEVTYKIFAVNGSQTEPIADPLYVDPGRDSEIYRNPESADKALPEKYDIMSRTGLTDTVSRKP